MLSQKKGSVNFLITFPEKKDLETAILYAKMRNGFQYLVCYSYKEESSALTKYRLFLRFNFSIRLPNEPFNKAVVEMGLRSMKKIKQWLKADNAIKMIEIGEYFGKQRDIDEVYKEREEEKDKEIAIKKKKIEENENISIKIQEII